MQIESISLHFPAFSGWLALILAALSVAFTVWHYRSAEPSPSLWIGRFLIGLRSLALVFFVLAFVMPVFSYIFSETFTPKTAVLLDTSLSMDIPEDELRGRDARDTYQQIQSSLGESGEYYTFDSGLRLLDSDGLDFSGAATDMAAAIRSFSGRNDIAALVLLTDGRWNLGENPAGLDFVRGVPVHSVGVGSYNLPGDISLLSVSAPPVVYAGDEAKVTVTLVSNNAVNEAVPVEVLMDGKVIASLVAAFENGMRTNCDFSFPMTETGLHSFETRIRPTQDAISSNNSAYFDIQALKSRFKVLVFSAGPSADTGFLRRTLEADGAFDSDFIVAGMSDNDSVANPDPGKYDLIVVIDGGGNKLNAALAEKIVRSVENGAGLLCFGSRFSGAGMSALETILPVDRVKSALKDAAYHIAASKLGATHFLTTGAADGADSWRDLPPLHAVANTVARKSATVLAEAYDPAAAAFRIPAIVAGRHGAGNIVVMPFSGLWRWKLMLSGSGKRFGFYDSFMAGTLRWLATEDAVSPLKISTGKSVYFSGEQIEFEARLYDSVFMPVSGASVTVAIDSLLSRKTLLKEDTPALYSGIAPSPGTGEHLFRATAWSGSEMLAEATGSFIVTAATLERLNLAPDHETLGLISQKSGGISVSPSGLDSLTSALAFAAVHERSHEDKRPWLHPFYPLLIIALLSVEWTIRKRQGML